MKTIVIEVDDESGCAYQNLSFENKRKIHQKVLQLMKKAVCNERVAKLKKAIDVMNNDPGSLGINVDSLLEILRFCE